MGWISKNEKAVRVVTAQSRYLGRVNLCHVGLPMDCLLTSIIFIHLWYIRTILLTQEHVKTSTYILLNVPRASCSVQLMRLQWNLVHRTPTVCIAESPAFQTEYRVNHN